MLAELSEAEKSHRLLDTLADAVRKRRLKEEAEAEAE